LSVRRGEESYDYIIGLIEEKEREMNEAFDNSDLPSSVSMEFAHDIIMQIRS
jgi:hypothetical protein